MSPKAAKLAICGRLQKHQVYLTYLNQCSWAFPTA